MKENMERFIGKEVPTYVVKCTNHGILGYVYSAAVGMTLFEGHRQMMTTECGGVEIFPKTPPIIKEDKFVPP
jgi:hypothetical protein